MADAVGFGFSIAKSLAECGAEVAVASWPPAMGIFETMLRRGKMDDSRRLPDGIHELHCHPDGSTDAGRRELEALLSPAFREALAERGAALTTYAALDGARAAA